MGEIINKSLSEMFDTYNTLVNTSLENRYKDAQRTYSKLYEAMRYSLLSGGKRIRPALTLETCQMLGGQKEAALPFAIAIESVHTYSLIHDDLPCMDDDDLRRGKPTNHKVFGEAYAVLAGDGLLTDAFMLCANNDKVDIKTALSAVKVLSESAGSYGMVQGQAIDMFGEDNELSFEELKELHAGKTGAMIRASVQLGCLSAGVNEDDPRYIDLTEFANRIGLVFQIVDDVLDVTSNIEVLGKNTGADKANGKTTFLSFFTIDEAMAYARRCTDEAVEIIQKYKGSERLIDLALYLCERKK